MTVQDLIVGAWEDLGEPSDLDPYTSNVFDITTTGAVQMLKWLNRGYRRITSWRYLDGHLVRFKSLEKDVLFQMPLGSGDVSAATSSTVTLGNITGLNGSGVLTTADYLNNWNVEITSGTGDGQKRVIVDMTNAGVCTIAPNWDTTPDATSDYKVYKRYMKFVSTSATGYQDEIALDPVEAISDPLAMWDINDNRRLGRGNRISGYPMGYLENAVPTEWIWFGERVLFNCATDDQHWYRFEYYGIPTALTTATQSPQIPAMFHDAIQLYMVWIGLRRDQEFSGAYATKRDLQELMRDMRQQGQLEMDREDSRMIVIFE